MIQEQEATRYVGKVLDANIESWLEPLGSLTFATRLIPLTLDHAQLFVDLYEADQKGCTAPLGEAQKVLLGDLAAAIDAAIDSETGVFAKTSCRSAKDVTLKSPRFHDLFHRTLATQPDKSVNSQIIAMLQAATSVLCVHTAAEILAGFRLSERIYQDMRMALMQVRAGPGSSCKRTDERSCVHSAV